METRHVKSEPLFNKVDKVDQPTTIDRHCDENKQIDLIEILLDTMDEADHIRTLNGDIIGQNWVELVIPRFVYGPYRALFLFCFIIYLLKEDVFCSLQLS